MIVMNTLTYVRLVIDLESMEQYTFLHNLIDYNHAAECIFVLMVCLTAVSYTHLDVYKRQSIAFATSCISYSKCLWFPKRCH